MGAGIALLAPTVARAASILDAASFTGSREPLPAAYATAPCAGDWHGPAPWGTIPASPCANLLPAEILAGQPFASGVVRTASAAPQTAPLGAIILAGGGGASGPASPSPVPCCEGWTPEDDGPTATRGGDGGQPGPSPVPLPASLPLLLAGLGGLALRRRAR